jgi:transcription factor S
MKFCKKCKSLMLPKKDSKAGAYLACNNCGYTDKKAEIEDNLSTKITHKDTIVIIDETIEESTLPTTQADCPQCKNKDAYYWIQQTRASDEPETKFLKCTKCKHTWRDYS